MLLELELFALLRGQLNGKVSENLISTQGKVTFIADPVAIIQGTQTLDWNQKFFQVQGALSAAFGAIEVQTLFKVNQNFDFSASAQGTAKIPSNVPVFGGLELANAQILLNYTNNNIQTDDFIRATESINLFGNQVTVGIEVDLAGNINPIFSGLPPTNSYIVAPGLDWIILSTRLGKC